MLGRFRSRRTPPSNADRLATLELLLHHMTIEGERFWHRNGIFVSIVTGLLGLLALKYKDFGGVENIIVSVFGLLIAVSWLQTLRAGNFYAERWRKDAQSFLERNPDLAEDFASTAGRPRIERPGGPSSSMVMARLARASIAVWICILAIGAAELWLHPEDVPWRRGETPGIVCFSTNEETLKKVGCPTTATAAGTPSLRPPPASPSPGSPAPKPLVEPSRAAPMSH